MLGRSPVPARVHGHGGDRGGRGGVRCVGALRIESWNVMSMRGSKHPSPMLSVSHAGVRDVQAAGVQEAVTGERGEGDRRRCAGPGEDAQPVAEVGRGGADLGAATSRSAICPTTGRSSRSSSTATACAPPSPSRSSTSRTSSNAARPPAQAQKRFTTANRMRGKKHPNTAKLAKDKDGKSYVVDADDDLLAGGTQALEAGC